MRNLYLRRVNYLTQLTQCVGKLKFKPKSICLESQGLPVKSPCPSGWSLANAARMQSQPILTNCPDQAVNPRQSLPRLLNLEICYNNSHHFGGRPTL